MKGGATHYFPLPEHITDVNALARNVGFLSVTAHGTLTGDVFLVPDNTYIMFLGGAGHPIERRAFQIPDLQKYRFMQPDEENAKPWFERMFTSIQNRTLFANRLYKPNAPYSNETVSIYEPGDIVQDLFLEFKNKNHPFLLLGVWQCPIRADISTEFDTLNADLELRKYEEIDAIKRRRDLTRNGASSVEVESARIASNHAANLYKEVEAKAEVFQNGLFDHQRNKFKALELPIETTLYDVMRNLKIKNDAVIKKPIHFIVVEACRSIPMFATVGPKVEKLYIGSENNYGKNNVAVYKNHQQQAHRRRRFSLMARDMPPTSESAAASDTDRMYVTPAFTYTINSLRKIQSMMAAGVIPDRTGFDKINVDGLIYKLTSTDEPATIDEVESTFDRFISSSHALIESSVHNIETKLPPYKRFKPGDYVNIREKEPGARGFVVGMEYEEGYVMFRVIRLLTNADGVSTAVNELIDPYSLTIDSTTDEDTKTEIKTLLFSLGADVDAIIKSHTVDAVLLHEGMKFAHTVLRDNPTLLATWTALPPKLLTAWTALSPEKRFKPGDRVKIGDTAPIKLAGQEGPIPLSGKHGIVKSIELGPPGTSVENQLLYKLGINGIPKNIPRKPNVLSLSLEGGRRKTHRRRSTYRRKQTRRYK
jgi:hypothetical protein